MKAATEEARWVFGVHAVEESLAAGTTLLELWVREGSVPPSLRSLLGAAKAAGVPVQRVSRRQLDLRAGQVRHQGVAAALPPFPYLSIDALLASGAPDLLLACDRIQDPRNLGAVIRSAAAFNAGGVVLPTRGACGITPVVERAAAGAVSQVPVVQAGNLGRSLDLLKERGYWIAGAVAQGGAAPVGAELPRPLCLVMGHEHKGLRPGILKRCDLLLTLNLPGGFESLNVATATGILLYEIRRNL